MEKYENVLSGIVIGICLEIHQELGPGLLESVYEEILCYELEARGIPFQRQEGVLVYAMRSSLRLSASACKFVRVR